MSFLFFGEYFALVFLGKIVFVRPPAPGGAAIFSFEAFFNLPAFAHSLKKKGRNVVIDHHRSDFFKVAKHTRNGYREI